MGYIAHHALIVTISGFALKKSDKYGMPDIAAYREGLPEHFRPLLVGPIPTAANDNWVVAFLPDGSKEGWDTSDEGDRIRNELIDMFKWQYEDGSSPYDVVLVRFGGDDPHLVNAHDPRGRGYY
ncbi:Uncharacterised protein [Mycobacteroides abscessus subsp. abscessus]|uniref:hypothetical protein n=1 Tax=Mycobacteroides abscessus TaxID=36809 RepID=UPI000926EAEA|nr:hypothetical protein [Mycobacteroides abscessus]SHU66940.1 Uncharacterised protein [Mycobacteroides abscessus subsp. abscessus]